jgi:hypothetical protein
MTTETPPDLLDQLRQAGSQEFATSDVLRKIVSCEIDLAFRSGTTRRSSLPFGLDVGLGQPTVAVAEEGMGR